MITRQQFNEFAEDHQQPVFKDLIQRGFRLLDELDQATAKAIDKIRMQVCMTALQKQVLALKKSV